MNGHLEHGAPQTDDYIKAFEDFRDLAVSHLITSKLEELDMQFPKPTVNIADVRRRYQEAKVQAWAS